MLENGGKSVGYHSHSSLWEVWGISAATRVVVYEPRVPRAVTVQSLPAIFQHTESFLLIVRWLAIALRDGGRTSRFSLPLSRRVLEDTRSFQHLVGFYNYNHLIVIADIDRGLYSASTTYCYIVPTVLDLPALVRHHPLYFLLRVCRELCFW